MVNTTVWSKLNSQEWLDLKSRVDWMSTPWMYHHITQLMNGVGWIEYARDTHLNQLETTLASNEGINMLSVGCGNAWIEMNCLDHGWPIKRIHCIDYDEMLLREAENKLHKFPIEKQFSFFDLNNSHKFDFGKYDLIFFCHSFHHCMDLEGMMKFINKSLKPDGIILGCDYFGPSRLQVDPEIKIIIDKIFEILPNHLRFNILSETVESNFEPPLIQSVMEDDPSEAPRSRDLRSMLFSNFPVFDIKPMGGTIMRPLFSNRAGNFRSESDHIIARLLQLFERILISENVILSDDLFFVLGKSNRV